MIAIQAKITTASEMRAFASQRPKTAMIFGELIGRWRGSRARRDSAQGFWAAYTQAEWCAWVGLKSTSTLKVHLDHLEAAGLIERQRGHHMGNRVVSFIRPTAAGLRLAKPRPNDWQLLGIDAPTLVKANSIETIFAAAYETGTGLPLKVMTKVERKALKDIEGSLPAEAVQLVDICVREWVGFVSHVSKAAAVHKDKLPDQPSAKFIRIHLQSACDFVAKQAPLPKTVSSSSTENTPIKPVKSIANMVNAIVDPPMTKAEMLAILSSDDNLEPGLD